MKNPLLKVGLETKPLVLPKKLKLNTNGHKHKKHLRNTYKLQLNKFRKQVRWL